MLIRAAISGRSSPVATQLSTVSSWSLAALPLPAAPQPRVIQYRENVDHHVVLCMLASLPPWSGLASPTLIGPSSALCSIWP